MAPCYWPEVRRGTERFARELADGLIADGRRPTLVTSHPGRPSRAVEDGLGVIRLPRPPSGALDRRLYEDYLTHLPLSAAAVLALRPSVAHALYPTDGVVAGAWSRLTGRPSVLSYMGIPDATWLGRKRLRRRALARAAATCDAVVALSAAAAAEFRNTMGVEARVIPPGVDLDVFSPGGERSPDPTIFCAASVHTPAKRVQDLVAAFALVRRELPGARLLLSRPEAPGMAGDGVEFIDVDDRVALRDSYRAAWVSALPSVGEAFGLVVLESMACGTPVVGRRAGAIPELVDRPAVGVLFEGGPAELAEALLKGLELGADGDTIAACRARAEPLSTAACTRAYENLYDSLEADRKGLG